MKNGFFKALAAVCLAVVCLAGNVWATTITYDLNCTDCIVNPATIPDSEADEDGNLIGSLPSPTRDDYTFKGWWTVPGAIGGTQITAGSHFSTGITIYARWELNVFTVTFNLNYAGAPAAPSPVQTSNVEATAGKLIAALPTPTRTDYTLVGWFTTSATTGGTQITVGADGYKFSGPTTIYARWSLNIFTVTFNLNYTGAPAAPSPVQTSSVEATAGKLIAALPTPPRDGYIFNGWFNTSAATGGTQITAAIGETPGYKFGGNATIYARWTAIDYTVNFNLNGGTGDPLASLTTVHYGDKITLPPTTAFTKSGYVNDGKWHTKGTGTLTSNTVVFAENFEAGENGWVLVNDGQVNKWMISSTDTVTKNSGYYSAYISNNNSTNSYTETSTSIVHLYKEIEFPTSSTAFTLTFSTKVGGDANDLLAVKYKEGDNVPVAGSQFGTGLGTYTEIISGWALQTISLPSTAFSGKTVKLVFTWVNDDSGVFQPPAAIDDIKITGTVTLYAYPEFTAESVVTSDTTLYLKWIPQYTLRFNPNGGTGDIVTKKTGADSKALSWPTPPTRDDGYTFLGWYRTATGATTGTGVTADSVINANATLFARWTITSYAINYVLPDGVTTTNPLGYTIETPTIILTDPSPRPGYTFAGWVGGVIGETPEPATSIPTGSTGPRTYTATWTPSPHVLSFDLNGGTGVAPAPINTVYDAKIPLAQKPSTAGFTKAGYVNDGEWYYRTVEGYYNPTGIYNVTILMRDSYGDGWNNNALRINVNGTNLSTNATLSSGQSSGTYTFNVSSGNVVSIYWVLGSYPAEVAFAVYYTDNPPSSTFNPSSGSANDNSRILVSKQYGSLTSSSSTGTLLGSFTAPVAAYTYTKFVFGDAGTQIKGDTTLYLKWVPSYTVSFNANGGTVTPESRNTDANGKVTLPTPTKNGYTFKGWYTTSTGTVEVTANTVFTAATTIYAQWTLDSYTITYDLGGGTVATVNPVSYNVGSAAITLNNPTKVGYTFAGWTGTDITVASTAVIIPAGSTGNREYTATWTPLSYVVKFDLNGGSGIAPDSISAFYDSTLATLQKPSTSSFTKSGFANDGKWYTRTAGTSISTVVFTENFENGTNGWVFVNGEPKNKWMIGTATYQGTGSHSAYISYNDMENVYAINNSASVVHLYKDISFPESSSDFTMTFYFKGVGESCCDYMSVKYSDISYVPVFDDTLSGNKVVAINDTYKNNSTWQQKTITLPAEAFSGKTMRLIFSWRNDKQDGTQSPAAIDNISITGTVSNYTYSEFMFGEGGTLVKNNTTLYLRWFPAYTISFHPNGGSVSPTFGYVINGWLADSLPTPTRDGYTFVNWFTAPKNGTKVVKDSVIFTSDSTIYAQWTKGTPIISQIATGNQIVQTNVGINLVAKTDAIIEIYNLSGKLISKQSYIAGNHNISISHLPKGIYIVQARFVGEPHNKGIKIGKL